MRRRLEHGDKKHFIALVVQCDPRGAVGGIIRRRAAQFPFIFLERNHTVRKNRTRNFRLFDGRNRFFVPFSRFYLPRGTKTNAFQRPTFPMLCGAFPAPEIFCVPRKTIYGYVALFKGKKRFFRSRRKKTPVDSAEGTKRFQKFFSCVLLRKSSSARKKSEYPRKTFFSSDFTFILLLFGRRSAGRYGSDGLQNRKHIRRTVHVQLFRTRSRPRRNVFFRTPFQKCSSSPNGRGGR